MSKRGEKMKVLTLYILHLAILGLFTWAFTAMGVESLKFGELVGYSALYMAISVGMEK